MAQSINHNSSDLSDMAKPSVATKVSILEIVQDFSWFLDHNMDKARIARDLLNLYSPKTVASRDDLADICVMYLNAIMYEMAKYAAQFPIAHKDVGIHNKSPKTTTNPSLYVHTTDFIRRNADGRWELCRVYDSGTLSIQDISWYDAENRVKAVLTESTVLDTVVSVLDEDKKYMDEDKTRVAADIIDAIAREVA